MKVNRFKRIRSEGEVAVGHMIMEFNTRGMARMLDIAGLDFVLIDMEHASFSTADVADLIAWLHAGDVAPFVRVPQIEYHLIARVLDAGALGIMVPNVKDGTAARSIVDAVKYAPMGKRGVALGGALTSFKTVDPPRFLSDANHNTSVICQIESEEGLKNIEDIAATPGVDVLWVGHFDMTQSMGIPGQFQHQKFLEGLKKVVATAENHGLGAGIQPGDAGQARTWMEMGFNVISYSADYAVYMQSLANGVKQIRSMAAS